MGNWKIDITRKKNQIRFRFRRIQKLWRKSYKYTLCRHFSSFFLLRLCVADCLSRVDDPSICALLTLQTLGTQKSKQLELCVELTQVDTFTMPTLLSVQHLLEEQDKDPQIEQILRDNTFPLTLSRITWGQDHTPIFCNLKGKLIRPYIPASLGKKVFDLFHGLSHPGHKPTMHPIQQKYVLPKMDKDVHTCVKNCLRYQQCKVNRCNKFLPADFELPD